MNILEEVQKRFESDFHSPADEWEYLSSLVTRAELHRLSILKWVFSESSAYWDTRARAGKVLLQENEEETWEILEKLVHSSDPDDNGTALTMFENLGDSRGIRLARHWLTEETHPATQFEASYYLWDIYPEQVKQCLQLLLHHPQEGIQQRAQEILTELL